MVRAARQQAAARCALAVPIEAAGWVPGAAVPAARFQREQALKHTAVRHLKSGRSRRSLVALG